MPALVTGPTCPGPAMNGSGNPARQNECPGPVAGRADAETRKIAAALSSQLGSIKNTDMGLALAWRVSKAGLNMGLRTAAHMLSAKAITVPALHPGWVTTYMGGDVSPAEPADSAAGLYKLIRGTPPKALCLSDCEGKTLPL